MSVLPNFENEEVLMTLEMFQKVRLENSKTAHIVEIFNNGEFLSIRNIQHLLGEQNIEAVLQIACGRA